MVVSLATTGGAARIYTVNGGGQSNKSASAWLEAKVGATKKRKGGQGGTGGEGDIRLIQDFDFPEASNKIKSTRDGQYVIATGTYKPRMKVFDLEELSMKTERVTDSENVDFCILSSDWTKTLHLQSDRSLELHTQSSAHYSVRMPRHGRALAYHFPSCDALVGGQGGEVWRLNLELGRFMKPFALEGSAEADGGEAGGVGGGEDAVIGVNAIDINPAHQLLSFGTETSAGRGTVEMWDPRSRSRAALLRLPYGKLMAASGSSASLLQPKLPGVDEGTTGGISVTALASKFDGLNLAVGTSTGHVLLYDLRANREYTTKDQGYGLPIKKVEWIESGVNSGGDAEAEGGWVASVDEKVVKIWGKETGTNLVSINPPMPINDMHVYPSTGLMFLANETSPMTGYYIPQLGPAPKWCRFLDNMTEEMEEDQEVLMYDDYKFVDRQELDSLNLTHLIGSDTLKPYMHGYFLDLRLYTKARAIANPFAYAEHRERLVREKLEKEQESRIRGAKVAAGTKLPSSVKVNRSLAKKAAEAEERAQKRAAGGEEEDDGTERKRKKKGAVETPSLLKDDRFGDLFTNPDFQIDEDSREFQLLNPSTKPRREEQEGDEEEDEESDGEGSYDSDSSIEGDLGFDNRKGRREPLPRAKRERDVQPARSATTAASAAPTSRPKPSLVVADDSDDDTAGRPARTLSSYEQRASQTFGQRAREAASSGKKSAFDEEEEWNPTEIIRGAPGGGMEMSFIPTGRSEREKDEDKAKAKAKAKAKEDKGLYGAGLENRADGKEDAVLEGEEGSGRQKMRKGVRSASRTVVRQLK
ncbi:rRNA processing protein Enp2 [Pseudohyphozyma bogoriensis]|nr:rRNA processing protein Enp2 [Pseudohyphozyma bogoriensis]